jgi:hypothetical protein
MVAIRVLIKEVATDVRDGEEKRVKVDALAKEEVPKAKEMAEMEVENQDGETETFEDWRKLEWSIGREGSRI